MEKGTLVLSVVLYAVVLSGCTSGKNETSGEHVKTSSIMIDSVGPYFVSDGKDSLSKNVQIKPVSVNYPADYTYRENWKNIKRGGAALRQEGYRHVIASPYEIYDQGKKHITVIRDLHTDVMLSSLQKTGNDHRSSPIIKAVTPTFCGENWNGFLLKETPENRPYREQYIRIKEKYCSDPNAELTPEEMSILNRGEPSNLRDYRMKMFIDNPTQPATATPIYR